MKHAVSTLEGALLDAAVAKAEGWMQCAPPFAPEGAPPYWWKPIHGGQEGFKEPDAFSSSWAHAGPIIEREQMNVGWVDDCRDKTRQWNAYPDCIDIEGLCYGPTPLVAAMRAYVWSKFGEEVELP